MFLADTQTRRQLVTPESWASLRGQTRREVNNILTLPVVLKRIDRKDIVIPKNLANHRRYKFLMEPHIVVDE